MQKALELLVILMRIAIGFICVFFLLLASRVDSKDELGTLIIMDLLAGLFIASTVSRIYDLVFAHREGHRKWKSRVVLFVSWLVISGSLATLHDRIAHARWYVPPRFLAMNQLKFVSNALSDYMRDCGEFPLPDPDCSVLIQNPGIEVWSGPYIELDKLKDPWGSQIRCEVESNRIIVRSAGSDRIFGTIDDLTLEVPRSIQYVDYER